MRQKITITEREKNCQKMLKARGVMLVEFVRFLLFTGPSVLQDVLSQNHYLHFLSFTIFLDDNVRRGHNLEYAQNILGLTLLSL